MNTSVREIILLFLVLSKPFSLYCFHYPLQISFLGVHHLRHKSKNIGCGKLVDMQQYVSASCFYGVATAIIIDRVNWLLCKSLPGLGVEGFSQSAASEVRKAVL